MRRSDPQTLGLLHECLWGTSWPHRDPRRILAPHARPSPRLISALSDRYRIERELGAGGMATVYLAEDLKHHRQVAIKVLKPELAAVLGAERFVQEITTTAQLQHPHILPLFDSGEADGFLFYVMPYVEGETLRDKLDRETQFGVDEAVRIAREIADALDYAHRRGVIHRDIKPENILLHDGRPMVADFGIALALSAAAGGRMTETGMSLGTPHYMSPEQATADKEITGRSDVYSLASVMYEMLAGDPPHTGSSAQQIIVKIIADEARPVGEVRRSVPPNVAAALGKALEKLPADRFETAKAFADALADPSFRAKESAVAPGALGATGGRSRATTFLAAAVLVLLAAAAWGWLRPVDRVQPLGRFEISIPPSLGAGAGAGLTVSPDGNSIIFQAEVGNFVLRRRGDPDPIPLGGGLAGWTPFFSPDGANLGYLTGFPGSLMTAAVGGSVARVVVRDSTVGYGGAWGEDDVLYYTSNHGDLMRVPASGGAPEVVARPDTTQGQRQIVTPDLLPGGGAALVIVYGDGAPQVGVTDFATGATRIIAKGSVARFGPPDYVIVGRETGELVALPFDARRRVVTGAEVHLADNLGVIGGGNVAGVSVTRAGELYYESARGDVTTLVRVDRHGHAEPLDPDWHDIPSGISISPDGTRLAVSKYAEGRDEVWVKTLDRGPLSRVAYGGPVSYRPSWSSDGRWIYFVSDRDQAYPESVYRVSASGGARPELIYRTDVAVDEAELSRDGQWLVYRAGSGSGRDVYAVRLGTEDRPVPIANSDAEEASPALSPDGRFVAYVSDESGRPEVYVRPFPDAAGGRWAVSTQGGTEPRWSHGGRELFYRSGNKQLVAVRLAPGPTFTVSGEAALFSTADFMASDNYPMYDVLPDDQGFIFARVEGAGTAGAIMVVQNWRQAVKLTGGR